jgi:hypothetical protein
MATQGRSATKSRVGRFNRVPQDLDSGSGSMMKDSRADNPGRRRSRHASCRLTFELNGRQRQGARPGLAKMYRVPPARAWWPAVGAPLERGVRPHCSEAQSPHQRRTYPRDAIGSPEELKATLKVNASGVGPVWSRSSKRRTPSLSVGIAPIGVHQSTYCARTGLSIHSALCFSADRCMPR